jgi:hypothetical protein
MDKNDFDICKQAGIGSTILARLANVSRVTASLWINGHARPHRLLASRITTLLRCIRMAVEANELPLVLVEDTATQLDRIHNILVKHILPRPAEDTKVDTVEGG